MFLVKKLLTYFILPPGIFIAFFIFLSFYLKRRWVRNISLFSGLTLYLISITPIKDLLLYPLIKHYQTNGCKGDIVVVLGGGVYGNGEIGDDPAKRLLKAYEIHKREAAPMVLSGGRVSEKLPIEADIMRNILIGLGVDKNKIDVDNESKDTLENAKYVAKIIGLDKKIILVTSAYHMKRSEMLFKKVGFKNLCTEAADFKFDGKYTFYDILPTTCNLNTSSKVLKEYLGIIFYYIFG